MQVLCFDQFTFQEVKTRKLDVEYEQKKLIEPELLALANSGTNQWSLIGFRGRLWDAGYRTAQSWHELLGEMKQAKNPAACFGGKTKKV